LYKYILRKWRKKKKELKQKIKKTYRKVNSLRKKSRSALICVFNKLSYKIKNLKNLLILNAYMYRRNYIHKIKKLWKWIKKVKFQMRTRMVINYKLRCRCKLMFAICKLFSLRMKRILLVLPTKEKKYFITWWKRTNRKCEQIWNNYYNFELRFLLHLGLLSKYRLKLLLNAKNKPRLNAFIEKSVWANFCINKSLRKKYYYYKIYDERTDVSLLKEQMKKFRSRRLRKPISIIITPWRERKGRRIWKKCAKNRTKLRELVRRLQIKNGTWDQLPNIMNLNLKEISKKETKKEVSKKETKKERKKRRKLNRKKKVKRIRKLKRRRRKIFNLKRKIYRKRVKRLRKRIFNNQLWQ